MISNYHNFIFEVSQRAPRALRQLEKIIEPLTNQNISENEANTTLQRAERQLYQFTGVPVRIYFKPDLVNMMTFPNFDFDANPSQLKGLIGEQEIGNIKDVMNISASITRINIIIGHKFITDFKLTAGEIVAIILHELGHIYYHKSFFSFIFKNLLRALSVAGIRVNFLASIFIKIQTGVFEPVFWVIGYALLMTTRTLSFFEHREEYNCDKVAAQFGYGMEMESALSKLQGIPQRKNRWFFTKFTDFVKRIANIGSHPDGASRACNVAKSMLKEYADLYPDAREIIQQRIRELRC